MTMPPRRFPPPWDPTATTERAAMSGRARAKFICKPPRHKSAGISFAPVMAWEVVVETECSKMTLSIDGHPLDVSRRVTYLSANSRIRPDARASKTKRLNDPWACQMEGQAVDLKRRIPILKRLIADCDRLSGDLGQEVSERGGPRQNPRSRSFRLFDLRKGDCFETR